MKKNKIFFILFALVLSFVPIQNSYSANVIKSGSVCKTKNQNVVFQLNNFICTKSGKKLVWKPVNLSNKTETALFSAWSTNFNTDLMVKSAIKSTDKYFGKVTPDDSYEIYTDKEFPESNLAWILKMFNYTNGAFRNIENKKFKVFIGTNHEWSKQTLNSLNLWMGNPEEQYPCSNGKNDAYCADKNLILLIFKNKGYYVSVGHLSLPAHEVFHTIQYSLLGYSIERFGPGHPQRVPRWFMEGSANYFGYYMVEKLGFDSYENGRNDQVQFNSEYRNIKPLSTYDNFESNPYGIGQAATEYIIASVGFESLLNIFKFTGTEGTFSAGFKKATGIEIEDFYYKFEKSRNLMSIGSNL